MKVLKFLGMVVLGGASFLTISGPAYAITVDELNASVQTRPPTANDMKPEQCQKSQDNKYEACKIDAVVGEGAFAPSLFVKVISSGKKFIVTDALGMEEKPLTKFEWISHTQVEITRTPSSGPTIKSVFDIEKKKFTQVK